MVEVFGIKEQLLIERDRLPARVASLRMSFGTTRVVCFLGVDASGREQLIQEHQPEVKELPSFARHVKPPPPDVDEEIPCAVHAFGWPLRASKFELLLSPSQTISPDQAADWVTETHGRLEIAYNPWQKLGLKVADSMWLPLLPLWRGLIANTLFYALLLWLLHRGFVRLRGWRRSRRGRCGWRGGCGYDLSGSVGEVCPECGRPVGGGGGGKATAELAG
ncbi:MAG: hypothetical protein HND58_12385 [Planctomycetota bacterium]|nr:MAG: hypothetical protein HND58_12385 [Planctomycetota bacterium]